MSATHDGEARGGRATNGLSAAAYDVLADCDPQVAAALLTALRTTSVAAYSVPYAGSVGGYLDVRPPSRPLLRVWVDAAMLDTARAVLADHLGTPPAPATAPMDEDVAWQEIVASLRHDSPEGPAPWPTAEGSADGIAVRPRPARSAPPPRPLPRRTPTEPPVTPTEPPVEPAAEPVDIPDEHFEPPPPPPLPQVAGASAYGTAAIVAGFLVLVVPTMAGDPVGPGLLVLAITAIVGGFVALVARMREGPPTDSGPDDGAVV